MSAAAVSLPLPAEARPLAASTALWLLIAVVSVLFGLFFAAYVMRLTGMEGYPLSRPWQFWLSSGLLLAGSLALQLASRSDRPRALLLAGGLCALGFVLVQLWAWQVLLEARVLPAGNPAASFLYVLTGLHALHVLGGLIGWLLVWRRPATWRIALCARYWHFLLLLWLGLFATLSLLTPDLVRLICGGGAAT